MTTKRKMNRKKSPQPVRKPRAKRKVMPVATMVELQALLEVIGLKQAEYNHKFAIAMGVAKMPTATTAVCFECNVARPRNQPCDCPPPEQQPQQ